MRQPDLAMPTPLVNSAWLQAHLEHPGLVIIDCRFALRDPQQGRSTYTSGHIPGAHYLDLNQDLSGPVQSHGGRHPLPDLDTFVAKLEALGVSSNPATAVIAYDATKGAFAARLWWLLTYLGHHNVAVLDGGWPAWEAARLPIETVAPTAPRIPGRFTSQPQLDWIVDRAYVQQHKDQAGTVLVDSRSPERYRGEHEPIDPIAGSIPGAINIFWQENLDDQGRFKPEPELRQPWAKTAAAASAIVYCGSGVTACVNILAHRLMNRPIPKLYVGGWSDWCSFLNSESLR